MDDDLTSWSWNRIAVETQMLAAKASAQARIYAESTDPYKRLCLSIMWQVRAEKLYLGARRFFEQTIEENGKVNGHDVEN